MCFSDLDPKVHSCPPYRQPRIPKAKREDATQGRVARKAEDAPAVARTSGYVTYKPELRIYKSEHPKFCHISILATYS